MARDLARRGLPREKVLATIVRLLETTLIRVGNEEYARDNKSYGLTTLQDRHAEIRSGKIIFRFRGKSGKQHVFDIRNRKLANIVKRCRDLPGYELFQYIDESGAPVDITSSDVNDYLREISGADFTAKDFRTWAGTVLAARALQEFEKFTSQTEAKRNLLQAVEAVARMLGNTPAICRRCYVHPVVLESYLDGTLVDQLKRQAEQKLVTGVKKLPPDEAAVLMLLQQTLSRGLGKRLSGHLAPQSCLLTRLAPGGAEHLHRSVSVLIVSANQHKSSTVCEGCRVRIDDVVGQTVVFVEASPKCPVERILIALWN